MFPTQTAALSVLAVLWFVGGAKAFTQPTESCLPFRTARNQRHRSLACGAVCTRTFQFVDFGEAYTGDQPSICADGLVNGADLQLTHWSGNNTPDKYKADLSTEIAIKWTKLLGRDAAHKTEYEDAVVVNNHCDTDGLMTVWTLLNPDKVVKYEDLMVAGAAAGDFEEWGDSDSGMQLEIALSKLIKEAGNDKAAYEMLLPQVEDLLTNIGTKEELWGEEMAELHAQYDAVRQGRIKTFRVLDPKVSAHKTVDLPQFKSCLCSVPQADSSHASNRLLDVAVFDHTAGTDVIQGPVVSRCFPHVGADGNGRGVSRVLLATQQAGGGYHYKYQLPGYAWVDTITRPAIVKPDVDKLVDRLGSKWTGEEGGMTTDLCRTIAPVSTPPDEMVQEMINFERSLLPHTQ